MSRLLAEGIAEAPDGASLLEAVAAGLVRASSQMRPVNRELGPRISVAVAASSELQERAVLKNLGLATAMTDALLARDLWRSRSSKGPHCGLLRTGLRSKSSETGVGE